MVISVPVRQAEDLRPRLGSTVYELTDPQELRSHARVADARIQITAPGSYKAKLIRTGLHRLSMQEVKTTLPHIGYFAIPRNRSAFSSWMIIRRYITPARSSGPISSSWSRSIRSIITVLPRMPIGEACHCPRRTSPPPDMPWSAES